MSGSNKREQPLVTELRRTLKERNAPLSPEILGKLEAINSDLEFIGPGQRGGTRQLTRMFLAGLMGAVMILLLAIAFYPRDGPITNSLDDLDILSAQENTDFYNDLEFYAWLASTLPEGNNISTQ